jgi:hypothetical protein
VVTPRGSAPTYPVITLELDDGAATIFSIENETTGQALNFDRLTLQAGEVITIDLKRGRKSIVSSQLGSLRRTLLPGSQLADFCLSGKQANTLTVTTDNPALIVTFSMPIAHLSIGGGAR